MTCVGHKGYRIASRDMQRHARFRSVRSTITSTLLLSILSAILLLPSSAHADEATEVATDTESQTSGETASVEAVEVAEKSGMPYPVKPRLTARLRLEYDYREQGDSDDADFYGRFYASGRNYWEGKLDFYTSMRLHKDFDESSSTSLADDPFRSLDDSEGVTEDRVLQLYVDIHDRPRRLALRAGRQYIDIADYMQLDGAQLLVNENGKIGGRIYAGHPVSYYSSVSGDYAGGLSVVGRPWEGNQTRLTLAQYHDDSQDDSDRNYFLDIRQRWSETVRTRGQLSILNDEYRMARADYFYTSEEGETDFSLGGSYWGSFDAKTRVYSPLYQVLGEQDPYSYFYSRLTQQIAPHWFVSPGLSLRFVDADSQNAQNNRDYQNYDIALIYQPTRAFSASISLEYWEVEDADSFAGLSGELRYRSGRIWEISGGASYAEYTYDTYADITYTVSGGQAEFSENGTIIEESPYIKTYFIRGKWRILKHLTLRAQFDIEDNDASDDLAYRGRGSIEVRY